MSLGDYRRCRDLEGRFDVLAARLPESPVLALVDERVLALHPHVGKALFRPQVTVVPLRAGERVKTLQTLELVTRRALTMPRRTTVLAVGGGTVGDFATVFAHTFKRGVLRLIHVPTTLLAAVDSSVGGKGALNVGGAKNVLGVFHSADEAWLCEELFATLSPALRREGRLEAWKMVVTLDANRFDRWRARPPTDEELIRSSRVLKHEVVASDPWETRGKRVVLNFGHTMGHALEALSGYRVRHGDAVGLGMLYALDVGVQLKVTPKALAVAVEAALPVGRAARRQLARWLAPANHAALTNLLAADKKEGMVLLAGAGRWRMVPRALIPSLSSWNPPT